jgi:hypothetical protein
MVAIRSAVSSSCRRRRRCELPRPPSRKYDHEFCLKPREALGSHVYPFRQGLDAKIALQIFGNPCSSSLKLSESDCARAASRALYCDFDPCSLRTPRCNRDSLILFGPFCIMAWYLHMLSVTTPVMVWSAAKAVDRPAAKQL